MKVNKMAELLQNLLDAIPGYKPENAERMASLWAEHIDYPDEIIEDAFKLIMREPLQFFPSMGVVISKCQTFVNVRKQYLDQRHLDLQYDSIFIEKSWLELIASFERYGFYYDADIAKQNMERVKRGREKKELPENIRKEIEALTGRLDLNKQEEEE